MKVFMTNNNHQFKQWEIDLEDRSKAEMQVIKVYEDELRQKIVGFGGALTEASAYVWHQMSATNQKEIMRLYFGEGGNQYNFCRTHIQSCDFSLGNRAYVEENDDTCVTFSIEGDREYQVPFIKEALSWNPSIEFLASPWSPPAFMKSNKKMNQGGRLLEKYYDVWADIMTNYVLAYQMEGIKIGRLSVQNEPAAVQTWDSCVYTAKEEKEFACILRKKLDEAKLEDVKIYVWDHNKDLIVERTKGIFTDEQAKASIHGVAFHWYSGDHFEALECVHQAYPDKELIFTEGCVEYSRFSDTDQTQKAMMYAHDMIGNFKAGMNGFMDWNVILDETGGPNHVNNYCDAPIMCHTKDDVIDIHLSYYYIGHFSRFIQPQARRMLTSSYSSHLETVGFMNPNGEKVVIVLNTSDQTLPFEIVDQGKGNQLEIEPKSIMTLCW